MPTSIEDWNSLNQGLRSMRQAGQEQTERGLLGQATEMFGQPGGGSFQDMMGLAQQSPDPMSFMNKMGNVFQMKTAWEQKKIVAGITKDVLGALGDGKLDGQELYSIAQKNNSNVGEVMNIFKTFAQVQKMGQPEIPTETREIKIGGQVVTQELTPQGWNTIANSPRWNPSGNETVVYGADGQPVYRQGPSGTSQKEIGTIPPGFKVNRDERGSVVDMKEIPGGPADIAAKEKAEQIRVGKEGQAKAAQTVYEDTERALGLISEYGRSAAGIMGLTDFLPEAPANRLKLHIESIQGNIGIDKLLEIKKSGAGLGQVPQAQLEMLASVLGKLNTKMNIQDLTYNLQRVQEIYKDIAIAGGLNPDAVYKDRQQRYNSATDYLNKFK